MSAPKRFVRQAGTFDAARRPRTQARQKLYRRWWSGLLRLLTKREEPPEDPFAYVTAPRKPKHPSLLAAAAAPLDFTG